MPILGKLSIDTVISNTNHRVNLLNALTFYAVRERANIGVVQCCSYFIFRQ